MAAVRIVSSVVVAWVAWLLGQLLLVWRGIDYLRMTSVRDQWASESVVGLLMIVLGIGFLAVAAGSVALSWVGAFTLGLAQVLLAFASGFAWGGSMLSALIPSRLLTTLYPYHLFGGVHLVLGCLLLGLAAAAALRRRGGPRSTTQRALSLVAVPLAMVATVLLLMGAGRNLRYLQSLGGVEGGVVVLLVVAAVLAAAAAACGALSAVGPTTAGVLVALVGVVATLRPEAMLARGAVDVAQSWLLLGLTGGLLAVGAVLTVGGAAVGVAARAGRTPTP